MIRIDYGSIKIAKDEVCNVFHNFRVVKIDISTGINKELKDVVVFCFGISSSNHGILCNYSVKTDFQKNLAITD